MNLPPPGILAVKQGCVHEQGCVHGCVQLFMHVCVSPRVMKTPLCIISTVWLRLLITGFFMKPETNTVHWL